LRHITRKLQILLYRQTEHEVKLWSALEKRQLSKLTKATAAEVFSSL